MSFGRLIPLLCLVVAITACDDDPAAPLPDPAPAGVRLTVDSIALYPGEVIALEAIVMDSLGREIENVAIDWTSLDTDVVDVDSTGVIEAVSHGTTRLRVQVDDLSLEVPVRVTEFVQISGMTTNLCGLDVDGRVWCRGWNYQGLLGPESSYRQDFMPLLVDLRFTQIAVGHTHACGIATSGKTYCWGDDEDGKLGRGEATSFAPDTVYGGRVFVSLNAGFDHTCALDANGTAFCWGRPWEGQLGRGGSDSIGPYNAGLPDSVRGGHRWTALDAGFDNTCGVATDGLTYCWGQLLGDEVPTPVASMPEDGGVVSGDGWLACTGAGAAVYCVADPRFAPAFPASVTLPAPSVALSSFRFHACAVVEGGEIYCWGPDAGPYLGNGTIGGSAEPVRALADETFVDVVSGSDRVCGLTQQGAVYCWGDDVWDGADWTNEGEPTTIPLRIRPPPPDMLQRRATPPA